MATLFRFSSPRLSRQFPSQVSDGKDQIWYAIIHVLILWKAPPLWDSLGCEVQWQHRLHWAHFSSSSQSTRAMRGRCLYICSHAEWFNRARQHQFTVSRWSLYWEYFTIEQKRDASATHAAIARCEWGKSFSFLLSFQNWVKSKIMSLMTG